MTNSFSAAGGDQYPFGGAAFTQLGLTGQEALAAYVEGTLGGTIPADLYGAGGLGPHHRRARARHRGAARRGGGAAGPPAPALKPTARSRGPVRITIAERVHRARAADPRVKTPRDR